MKHSPKINFYFRYNKWLITNNIYSHTAQRSANNKINDIQIEFDMVHLLIKKKRRLVFLLLLQNNHNKCVKKYSTICTLHAVVWKQYGTAIDDAHNSFSLCAVLSCVCDIWTIFVEYDRLVGAFKLECLHSTERHSQVFIEVINLRCCRHRNVKTIAYRWLHYVTAFHSNRLHQLELQ